MNNLGSSRIVVIGSGLAGVTFAEAFKNKRPQSQVTLLTMDTEGYYSRPLLSHGFSRDDIEQRILLKSFEDLGKTGIEVRDGVVADAIDRPHKQLHYHNDQTETVLEYDKLVLAQGSGALIPGPFRPYRQWFYVLNSLHDLKQLRRLRNSLIQQGKTPRWGIVGGGLIGCEVASDLAKAGDKAVLFHAMPRLMERQLQEDDSDLLLKVLSESGIEVHLDCQVQSFEKENRTYGVVTPEKKFAGFDGLIVACGFKPRTELAEQAGLPINRGIQVNDFLTTPDPDIYAVGDGAELPDGRIYAYVTPVRSQALWLSQYLAGETDEPWQVPDFKPRAKVHGFNARHPYQF